jgi:hypothetical protein
VSSTVEALPYDLSSEDTVQDDIAALFVPDPFRDDAQVGDEDNSTELQIWQKNITRHNAYYVVQFTEHPEDDAIWIFACDLLIHCPDLMEQYEASLH